MPSVPYQPFQPPRAPEGTRTGTVWIWLIVLLPLLSLGSLFLIDMSGYFQAIMADPTSPTAALALFLSPGYLITVFGGLVLFVLTIVFAVQDVRELGRRQIANPFHWAFAFLGGVVYTIGRSIVVHRRTGGGLAPLWATIAVFVLSLIVATVWSVWVVQQALALVR